MVPGRDLLKSLFTVINSGMHDQATTSPGFGDGSGNSIGKLTVKLLAAADAEVFWKRLPTFVLR